MNDLPRDRDLPLDQSGEPMRCPKCDTRLVELERSSVLIDACPNCRGVWLDRGELDGILEREQRAPAKDDEDFLREMSGKGRARERDDDDDDDRRRRDDDRHRHHDSKYYKKKKRKSMMEELFDF